MARPAVLGHTQDLNLPPRVTRSTSQLQKEVIPTSDPEEDQEMDDEIILAPLPSGTSQSQDQYSSSQARDRPDADFNDAGDSRVEQREGNAQPDEMDEDDKIPYEERADRCVRGSKSQGKARETQSDGSDEGESAGEDDDDDDNEEEEGDDESSGESSARGDSRSEGEIQQIENEMYQLETSVPPVRDKYKLLDRLGEGTFSSVYKALDVEHSKYDNSEWSPDPPIGKVYVALKRIYVTSSPARIHNELEILYDLRGASNVAYLVDAIRHEDQVIAVMPYNRHQDFRSYYRRASLPMLRSYFSCLFRALAATHKLQIIHRDVKPANFLYDSTTGQGVLCDYGLAQKIGEDEFYEWKSECLHSLPGPSWGGLEGRRKSERKMERTPGAIPGLASGLHGVRMIKPLSLWEQTERMEIEFENLEQMLYAREDNGEFLKQEDYDRLDKMRPWVVPPGWVDDIQGRMKDRQAFYKGWRPPKFGSNMAGSQRIGYLRDEKRPSVRANRAGTRGFRAPEVLLKCPDQTVALDVWSAGIILLCFLTRRFPFFNSNDDTEALAEITAIFGKRKMERCAFIHNRTFVTNVPDLENPPHASLHALVKSLNPPIIVENSPNIYGQIPSTAEEDAVWYQDSDIYQAVDLMKHCLALDCTKRWTAEECLEHPFFTGVYDLGLGRTETRLNGHSP